MSKRRRVTLVRTLKGKITLLFIVIATLVPGLPAYNWLMSVQPRLKAEAESNAIALAYSHAYSLSMALSPATGAIQRNDIIKALDDILLLTDPNTNQPFINEIVIELDYDAVPLEPGSLDITKGESGCINCFVAEIPLYSGETKELIGIATFHVSGEYFRRVQREVINDLLIGGSGAFALMIFSWCIVVFLLKPLNIIFAATKGLRDGEYPRVPPIETSDELGRLADEFNTMSRAIRDREQKLIYSQKRVRDLFERVEHALFRMDSEFKIVECNTMFEVLCNKNIDFFHVVAAEKRDILRRRAEEGNLVGVEIVIAGRDGHNHTISLSVYPEVDQHGFISGFDGHFVDITEKKRMEEALRQTQKLESLGLLAGGVAHDFNNILTSIIGYSELSLLRISNDEQLKKNIEIIRDAGDRAAALTRQLLAFSRKQVMEVQVLSLNTLINNMTRMLGRLIGENIEMKLRRHGSNDHIKADPGQIEQIIMNLAVNAKDAMPDGGSLVFETNTVELDDEYCRKHSDLTPGLYVVFSVSDTGKGMTAEVTEKIFDPFFTTKEKGAGTGLGLSVVYGIVKQLRGHIFVYSEIGRGTTFKIFFPLVSESPEKVTPKALRESIQRGVETLLVVDDEASIRNLVRDTLQPLGYQVIEAHDGVAALEILDTLDRPIDLLLTDVIMPKMSGKELAERVEAVRPGIKVLFMSGYTDDVIDHQGILTAGIHFIHKPLVPSVLSNKVRQVLDDELISS